MSKYKIVTNGTKYRIKIKSSFLGLFSYWAYYTNNPVRIDYYLEFDDLETAKRVIKRWEAMDIEESRSWVDVVDSTKTGDENDQKSL